MPDMTPQLVRSQLAAIGLAPEDEEELQEVTHRINAISETVVALEHPDLDAVEPVTVFEDEAQ